MKKQGFDFKLKGGTSLSKGYRIIDRFSEDIDIYIRPPKELNVNENPKNSKPKSVESRKSFYDWLAKEIKIDGIVSVERDHAFDDLEGYRSGGIRLFYKSYTTAIEGIKEGILLEAGFDSVTPDTALTISAWALDRALENASINLIDNRAADISCYHPGYTFVEKLQTIATKFRREQEGSARGQNFMRQYYDLYRLLDNQEVLDFIGTPAYEAHKKARFPKIDFDIPIAENEAFLLNVPETKASFIKRYKATASLYYHGQPDFNELLERLKQHIDKL